MILSQITFAQTKIDTLDTVKKAMTILLDCEIIDAENERLKVKVETTEKRISIANEEVLRQFQFGKKANQTIQELKKTIQLGSAVINSDSSLLEQKEIENQRLKRKLDKRIIIGPFVGYGISATNFLQPQIQFGMAITYRLLRL